MIVAHGFGKDCQLELHISQKDCQLELHISKKDCQLEQNIAKIGLTTRLIDFKE